MSSAFAISYLTRQIEDAAMQRYFLAARHRDKELEEQGWQLSYAAGSDVFSLHAEPARRAAAGRSQVVGTGEIFRDDDDSNKAAIAAALGAFVWFDLQPDLPLLLIPPLNQSVRRTVAALTDRFAHATQSSPALEQVRARLQARGVSLEPGDMELIRQAALLDGEGRTLDRIRTLLEKGRLLSMDAGLPSGRFPGALSNALRPFESQKELNEFHHHQRMWLRGLLIKRGWVRLESYDDTRDTVDFFIRAGNLKVITRDGDSMEIDKFITRGQFDRSIKEAAEGMARLSLINNRLPKEPGAKALLLFITGDISLHDVGSVMNGRPNMSFTQSYIRHPRCFLDEPGVLRPISGPDGEHTTPTDVLDICLGRFDDMPAPFEGPWRGAFRLAPDALDRVSEVVAKDRTVAGATLDRWRELVRTTQNLEPPPTYLSTISRIISVDPSRLRQEIDLIRPKIELEIWRAWESYFEIVVELRFVIEVAGANSPKPRLVPNLIFEGKPAVERFFAGAESWLRNSASFSSAEYRSLRDGLISYEPGPSGGEPVRNGYYSYLAHGWLLATQGQWQSAAILAKRAGEASSVAGDYKPGRPNGRESKYFEAFCRRHSAKSRADIQDLDELLRSAKKIAEAEAGQAPLDGIPLDVVPERFESERIALALSDILFAWHDSGDISRISPEVERQLRMILQRIVTQIEDIHVGVQTAGLVHRSSEKTIMTTDLQWTDYRKCQDTRKQLLQRAWRNYFGIGLMIRDYEIVEDAWEGLRSELQNEGLMLPSNDLSQFGMLIDACGKVIFSRSQVERLQADKALEDFDDKLRTAPREYATMPYDRDRFRLWIKTARNFRR
jgi:hypothetical protein